MYFFVGLFKIYQIMLQKGVQIPNLQQQQHYNNVYQNKKVRERKTKLHQKLKG